MTAPEWTGYLTAAKAALDIFKGLRAEIPKGSKADEVQAQIERAELALQNSKVELAKSLGFKLCKCHFPPEIMLWDNWKRTNVCGRCGNEDPPPHTFAMPFVGGVD
jgi:hypothetical protein